MKQIFRYYLICWAAVLVLFNIITFTVTAETIGIDRVTPSFWVGYVFMTLALFGNLACSYFCLQAKSKNDVFLNIPVFIISYSALGVSFLASLLTMILQFIPYWIGILMDLIILVIYLIAVVRAGAAAKIVGDIDRKIKTQTFFIKSLTIDADTLLAKAQSVQARSQAKKVYEAIRYSDPMSNEALAGAESQITLKFGEFSAAIESNSEDEIQKTASELLILLNDRNKKCQLLK